MLLRRTALAAPASAGRSVLCATAAAAASRPAYALRRRYASVSPSSSSSSPAASGGYSVVPTARNGAGQLLSRVSGPTDEALDERSLSAFWDALLAQHGARAALVCKHEPAGQHAGADGVRAADSAGGEASGEGGAGAACLRWSFGAMGAHIDALARGLRAQGVRSGTVVAVLMMNNSAYAALQWATARLGAVLVTLNPSYSTRELAQALAQVQAHTLVLVPGLRTSDYLAALKDILPSLASGGSGGASGAKGRELQDSALPSLRRLIVVDNLSARPSRWEGTSVQAQAGLSFGDALDKLGGWATDYRDVLAEGAGSAARKLPFEDVDPLKVINLQLTSGTTGRPKAVALTSRNLLNNGIAIGRTLRLTPDDVLCNVPPLFHCFGLTLGNMAAWSHGASVVYSAEGFDPVRALRSVSEERCTVLHGVPAHFISELEVLDAVAAVQAGKEGAKLPPGVQPGEKFDLSSLRTGLTSGSTVPIELMHRIMHTIGSKEQTVVYGMTETSPVSFGCDVDAPVERRCETVGRIYPHCSAKIVDPHDPEAKPVPVGTPGEICTAGYIVMAGYWNDEAKTKEALQVHPDEPGVTWMRTGDVGVMDEEGYVRVVGRIKDEVHRGGQNLYPKEIEDVTDELPGVTQSAAVAAPDKRMGETVGIFIGRAPGAEGRKLTRQQVRQYVKDNLSAQAAPDWVWWLGEDGVPEELPKTASGKVKKVDLREWAKDLVEKGIGSAKSA